MFEEHYVNFCKELQAMIEGKTEKPSWFKPHGLCCNFYYYLDSLGLSEDEIEGFEKEQSFYYLDKFGTSVFPFNKGEWLGTRYRKEVESKTVYENKKRLRHIRKVATEGINYVA